MKMSSTESLPDECLALIFNFLTTTNDRNNSSLVSHRWFRIDAQTRTHLSLKANLNLQPSIFTRFNSLTQLLLNNYPSSDIDDHRLSLIASRCPNLTRLKLYHCTKVTYKGMAVLSQSCKKLKKFSCDSCAFGAKGIIALLDHCYSLEELSVKYLNVRKEQQQQQPLIINNVVGSNNLKTLKLMALFGDWDTSCFDRIIGNSLVEVHLGFGANDFALLALSKCSNLEVLRLHRFPGYTSAGFISLVEHCNYLKKLYIDNRVWNTIGDEALVAIAKYSLNLQELVLIGVDACCISLQAIAVSCRKLERLHLCSSNKITDLEISCIADKCVDLKKLLIKKCCVSDKGVEAFALGCPNLVEIRLIKCENVTPDVKDRLRARRGSLVVKLE